MPFVYIDFRALISQLHSLNIFLPHLCLSSWPHSAPLRPSPDECSSMNTTNSQFSTSTRTSSASSSTSSAAAGRPGISSVSGICSINVEEDNEFYGKVVWANCCARDKPSENCPPQTQLYPSCPVGFYNCADPSHHREMCTIALEPSGYTNSKPLNQKCCPKYVLFKFR